jgi:SAM-dependent methyltransferase
VDAVGVDLSPGMIAEARQRFPQVTFLVGSMLDLPVPDSSLAGVTCFYAIIHLDSEDRQRAYHELARVIAPGGWLLVAVHVSDTDGRTPGSVEHVEEFLGANVDLDFHFLDPDEVVRGLREAGFQEMASSIRQPWPGVEHPSRRAYLLVRRE